MKVGNVRLQMSLPCLIQKSKKRRRKGRKIPRLKKGIEENLAKPRNNHHSDNHWGIRHMSKNLEHWMKELDIIVNFSAL